MTTMQRALRGTIRLRWWRRYGMRVAAFAMAILMVCAIGNAMHIAGELKSQRKAVAVKPVVTTKVTLQAAPTLVIERVEMPISNELDDVQEYREEEFEIRSVNYYSANSVSANYCATEVVNPETNKKQQVYTYLGRTYTWEDIVNLARIAWFEQGVCGKEMTQLAAAVLINRSHWTAFCSTYMDCFYQTGQYSTYTISRYESSEEIPEEVYDWIVELLEGESEYGEVPTTVVFQAQFPQGIDTYAADANTYICYADESLLGEYIP